MKKIFFSLLVCGISFTAFAINNIAGGNSICVGTITQLSDATQNGLWVSDNTLVATVSSSGLLRGISGGTVKITHMTEKSGPTSITIVINPTPSAISGSPNVCIANTINLSDPTDDGTWATNNTSTSINQSGTVTGLLAGSSIITYKANGCITTTKVTVPPDPEITDTYNICAGAATTLYSNSAGGTWISGNNNATIGSSTGIVTGVNIGTSVITYTTTHSCIRTKTVTINASPAAITITQGENSFYVGQNMTLADTGNGTWSSNATSIATIGSTGNVIGVSSGTANISYTDLGCSSIVVATVFKNATNPSFSLTGTVYSGFPYIKDDNPAGFTQTFLKANINRKENHHSNPFLFFNNFYVEGYFSTNVGSLHTYDSISTKPISYINRLDLYQYANVKINFHQNIFYVHSPTINSAWKTVVYLDVMESFLRTNISDSISKNINDVNSWLLGSNLTCQVYNDKNKANLPWALRLSGEVFWINPMTNAVNPDLNFQYANRSDYSNQLNVNKNQLTTNPHPYYNIDLQLQFQISKANSSTNNDTVSSKTASTTTASTGPLNYLFFHVGYASNFAGSNSSEYYNNYLTAQIGLSIDIINSIKNYTGPSTTKQ